MSIARIINSFVTGHQTMDWRTPISERKHRTPFVTALADDALVTVCSACMRACCWQGEFMCDGAEMVGTTERTVAQLRAGQHGESEHYWAAQDG